MRWPTSYALRAIASWTGIDPALTSSNSKRFVPFSAAAPQHWVATGMHACAVDIRPSLTTRAEIGTVPRVRPKRASVGWRPASENSLATSYFHVVFTVPHELNVLALDNARLFYHLLFTASAQTLLEIAADPKHLGAKIGVISILHTWGQNLLLHPHIHCAIPAGGISSDHRRWISPRYPFSCP